MRTTTKRPAATRAGKAKPTQLVIEVALAQLEAFEACAKYLDKTVAAFAHEMFREWIGAMYESAYSGAQDGIRGASELRAMLEIVVNDFRLRPAVPVPEKLPSVPK